MAVVERFKQELMYGLSAGTKKMWPLYRGGRCGEVAVSGGSTVMLFSFLKCIENLGRKLWKLRL